MFGLFGKKKPQQMGGTINVNGMPVDMANVPTTAGGRFGDPMPQPEQERGGFFKPGGAGQLIFSAISDLGASLNDRPGGALAGMVEQQMAMRERAEKLAEAQRLQAQRMAQLQAAGVPAQFAPLLDSEGARQYAIQQLKPAELDAFDADMARAGIVKGSPEYVRLAQESARRRAYGPDPLLQNARLPNGGEYTGPYSGYQRLINGGQSQDAPQTLPADFFNGGTSGNTGGGFRR